MSSISKLSFRHALALAFILAAGVVLAFGVTARGQVAVPDISGEWSLSASALLPPANPQVVAGAPCEWQGGGALIQDGQDIFSQEIILHLMGGPAECPEEMAASLDGFLGAQAALMQGATPFSGILNGGKLFGMLSFSGQVGPYGKVMSAGMLRVTEGPFMGSTGTWNAIRAGARIPTVGTLGLVLLIALLLAASFWMLRQQRRTV